jgi:hypothetical protein
LALLWLSDAAGQESTLFSSDTPLVIRLEAPLRTILAERDEPEYRPAASISIWS